MRICAWYVKHLRDRYQWARFTMRTRCKQRMYVSAFVHSHQILLRCTRLIVNYCKQAPMLQTESDYLVRVADAWESS